jgi:hypothetical protein
MIKLPAEPSDPNLLLAMEKIKAVLKEHDIAGMVILLSKTHGEWLQEITPTWSVATMIDDARGKGIRFKALAKDFPSKEAHQEAARLTVGMLCGFRDGADRISRDMEVMLTMLAEHFEIEHISRFNR